MYIKNYINVFSLFRGLIRADQNAYRQINSSDSYESEGPGPTDPVPLVSSSEEKAEPSHSAATSSERYSGTPSGGGSGTPPSGGGWGVWVIALLAQLPPLFTPQGGWPIYSYRWSVIDLVQALGTITFTYVNGIPYVVWLLILANGFIRYKVFFAKKTIELLDSVNWESFITSLDQVVQVRPYKELPLLEIESHIFVLPYIELPLL